MRHFFKAYQALKQLPDQLVKLRRDMARALDAAKQARDVAKQARDAAKQARDTTKQTRDVALNLLALGGARTPQSPDFDTISRLPRDIELIKSALGRIEARQLQGSDIDEVEFKVFSQFGEDGILQRIIRSIPGCQKTFIEFGVQDYRESNTRFLLLAQNWAGLVMDGSAEQIYRIQNDETYWRYPLQARCAFITRENINDLLDECGFAGNLGILSVDVDGNDYWVWEAIDRVDPTIVVTEYNSFFGATEAVTVPYRADFDMFKAHWAGLFWGASAAALTHLAIKKGYRLVAGNSAGNNLFFVKADAAPGLPTLRPAQAWRPPQFKIARALDGSLSYAPPSESIRLMGNLEVFDVVKGIPVLIKALQTGL